jgi:uncharacterized spore protein YtfJ
MAKQGGGPLRVVRRLLRPRDVFGKPVTADGVTVVPVASVTGGGGGGERTAENPGPESGAGFGFVARPVGAYVIRKGKVRWRPAVDVTALAAMAMVSGLIVARWLIKSR